MKNGFLTIILRAFILKLITTEEFMKKFVSLLMALFLVVAAVYGQGETAKDILLKKIVEKYKDVNEMSVVVDMSMSMMGTSVKMPMKMWMKGNYFRADASMAIPGTDQTAEQITISDGNTISTYNSLTKSIMVVDLTKLPEETRKRIRNQYLTRGAIDAETLNQIKEFIRVEESTRNDRKIYLITIENFEAIRNVLKMPPAPSQIPFKKLVYMIDYESLFPLRMEVYTEGETPEMVMDFIEIKTTGVSDSIFNVKFPADAKKMDITETVKGMLAK